MPLPLAALVALAIGALFAHAARATLAQSDAPIVSSRVVGSAAGGTTASPFAVAVAFAAFVYLPALAYFAAFHGDWAYMYFVPWRRVPSAIDLAVVLACAALVPAGFLAAAPLARARRREAVIAMIAIPAGAAAALAAIFEHRLGTSATFAQFANDFDTHPIAATALGRAVLVTAIVCAAAVVWGVRLLHSDARAPARRVS